MAAKQIIFDVDAREKLAKGIEKLAKAVVSTLGPKGRTAVLDKGWGAPNITKDGVTVAEEIELNDPYENCAAQMVKQVASKTSDVAGDGTTTATLLAHAVYSEGLRHVIAGRNATAIYRGIEQAVERLARPGGRGSASRQFGRRFPRSSCYPQSWCWSPLWLVRDRLIK